MLTLRPGLAVGALWGVAWGITFYVVGSRSTSTGVVEGNAAWLVVLLTLAVLAWCWHSWRVTRYIQKQTVRAP
jgi:hypothetical protein